MAKFTNKDLRLKDGQKVTWGTDLDSNMWWDDAAQELRLDTVISGVDPTKAEHLTTRFYVDTEIATTSGSLQDQIDGISMDHGDLTGLGDDDHTQYVPTNADRGFTNTVSGIDPTQDFHLATKAYIDNELATISGGIVQDHGGLTGLGDDDHTQYSLADGTRAFTGVVGGITPTDDAHLTTKGYVDLAIQGLDWQDSVLSITTAASGVQTEGNRYIASETGGGWTDNNIYEWDGSAWEETVANEGMAVWVEDEDRQYVFNGTEWVPFGSTITHNNTNGLQGGTTDEYYHMTSDEYTSLTSTGGVEDASDMHTHDDRYYTETEMDATISGIQDSIITDHGDLTGLGDDDHSQYSLVDGTRAFTSTVGGVDPIADTDHSTKGYVDTAVSGVESQIITDHGALSGLGDDDHTQYVPTDGSRGFTATVSGVDPVLGSDLATKDYVDSADQPQLHGREAIVNGADNVVVSFTDVGSTNYTISAELENTSDSPPSIYAHIVSAKTSSSFTVTFMGDMDSANYILNWILVQD